ncbi:hypothetical protein IWW36_002577 [Coemansia brasiliensis]|uniref:Mid2 domain-containing protein n=1 Tax=Coemansia brasiliensis TaxID=2650707 RepID=A0A9W8LZB6_9FUNG|nr:hypothetical protein IWW36_002577 [Coemansia brasiliensis]
MCQALLAATMSAAHDAAPYMHRRELDNPAPSPVPTVAGRSAHIHQPRDIFDSLMNILNPGRQGDASQSDNANSDDGDNNHNNNNNNHDNDDNNHNSNGGGNNNNNNNNSSSNSDGDNNQTSDDDHPSDTASQPEPSSSSSEEPSSSSRESSSSSERSSSSETESSSSATSESSSETSSSSESPSPTSSESESSPTSMEVVTVTRPGVTKTTMVGPAPTIDQVNGDKADVGASGNQTSIIVATVVTAVALLLCTVLYYMYRRRRKLLEHREDDFFTKGAPSPPRGDNTISTTSPFIPPGQPSGDGYMPEGAYAAGTMPMGRHTDETFRSQNSANDSTHLLAQQQPMRQNSPPFAQPVGRFHQQMTQASAPPMTQVPVSQPPPVPGAASNRFTTQPMFNPRTNPAHSTAPPAPQQYAIPRPPILQQQQQQHSVFSPQMHASNHGVGYMS